jgi:aspartate racemase
MLDDTPPLCVGLIGGLGVGAAIHYYRELARAHAARGATLRLVMVHADISRGLDYIRAGKLTELAQYLAALIDQLRAAGADVAVIPAVTPNICAPDLAKISSLPLLSILTATDAAIASRAFRRVALFGTRFSIESDLFGQVKSAEIVRPQPAEIDTIHGIYTKLAEDGYGSDAQRQQLWALAHRLIERDHLDGIILAGTDLSLIFNEENTSFPHIDCARVHIHAIMLRLFAQPH